MKRLKNFFKKNLKVIIIFIVSMIITSMVSVYAAYNYLSTDVSYTKADGTTVSVADALNELYKNKSSSGSSSMPQYELYNQVMSSTINFWNYYADIDDDGTPDGIIFIDRAHGASGTGLQAGYSYQVKQLGLKMYQLSTKKSSYTDSHFGTHEVITQVGGSTGADRFYVMALSDYSTSTYTWADACKLTKTVGSVTFRLPSETEWAAFAGELGITKSNYSSTYGLNSYYWTSTETSTGYGVSTLFSSGFFCSGDKTDTYYARLCATF